MKYKAFSISGTSGVGKSHLETELEKTYGFHRMVTYTTRGKRIEEKGDPARVPVSEEEYDKMLPDFIFTLEYAGNRYGWLREEFDKYIKETNVLVVMTLEAMTRFVKNISGSVPVLLHIEPDNFRLLKERLQKRVDYKNIIDNAEKEFQDKKIAERVELAKDEVENIQQYFGIVDKYNGKIFEIKDDNTLYAEVIPWMIDN